MENTFKRVGTECSTQIKAYSSCIDVNPEKWNMNCTKERKEVTKCAEENVQDLKKVKKLCSKYIAIYNYCIDSHGQDPSVCSTHLENLYDCHSNEFPIYGAKKTLSKMAEIIKFRRQVSRPDGVGVLAFLTDNNILKLSWISNETFNKPQTSDLNLKDCLQAPLKSISIIKILPELSLHHGKACCIALVTICTDTGEWPPMLVEPFNSKIDSPQDILLTLRTWFRPFKQDLIPLEPGSPCFHFSDKIYPLPLSIENQTQITKLRNFGFGVLSSLLGTPVAHRMEDAGLDVLERFARITHFAKDKTTQVLEHPINRPLLANIPENVRSQFLSSSEAESLLKDYVSAEHYFAQYAREIRDSVATPLIRREEISNDENYDFKTDTAFDFEQQKLPYSSHFTGAPLTIEVWKDWHDENGELRVTPFWIACTVFCGGVEPSLRKELWPLIMGYGSWTANFKQNEETHNQKALQYSEIKDSWQKILSEIAESPTKIDVPHEGAVGDENENSDVLSKIKERKYRIDKDVCRTDQTIPYFKLSQNERESSVLRFRIDAHPNLSKLRNVLMTYTCYNFELGYVQGMNDLASPILHTIENESETFWTYVGFMEKMQRNFNRDQSGMRDQLRQMELLLKAIDPPLYNHMVSTDSVNMFCCFRWLLIYFKREFEFEEIKTLWEIIWMCPFTKNFHLFVAIAVLNQNRQELLKCKAFDEVLKYVNNLSKKIMVPETIKRAEVLYYVFRDMLIKQGPKSIGKNIAQQQQQVSIEITLGKISEIEKKVVLIGYLKPRPNLSDEEWLEVIAVLEIDEVFKQEINEEGLGPEKAIEMEQI